MNETNEQTKKKINVAISYRIYIYISTYKSAIKCINCIGYIRNYIIICFKLN